MSRREKNTGSKRKLRGLPLVLLGLLLWGFSGWLIAGLPDRVAYVLPVSRFSGEETLAAKLPVLGETLEGYEWTCALRQQNALLSAEQKRSISATVYAVDEKWWTLQPETLVEGRLLSLEDLENAFHRAVITREAADVLFPGAAAVGQSLRCEGVQLEIVGVIRGGLRPGEADPALIFVPRTLAEKDQLHLSFLEVQSLCRLPEDRVILQNLLRTWCSGGTACSFHRLRMNALVPLWLLALIAGFTLLRLGLKWLYRFLRRCVGQSRLQLQSRYPEQLLLPLAGRALACLAATALWIGGIYLFLSLAVWPMSVYTDWIPESLADPSAISTTFRSLLSGAAVAARYRTRAMAEAELASFLTWTGSLFLTSGIILQQKREGKGS